MVSSVARRERGAAPSRAARRIPGIAEDPWPPFDPHPDPAPPADHAVASPRDQRGPILNRELSWIEFNARVLHEARDTRNPLLERVKFLAIFASNLDEFFQVRVSGLRRQAQASASHHAPDGMTPTEQLAQIRVRVRELIGRPRGDLDGHPRGAARPRASRSSTTTTSRSTTRRSAAGSTTRSSRSSRRSPSTPATRSRTSRTLSLSIAVGLLRPGDRRAALRPGQDPAPAPPPVPGRARQVRPPRPGHRGEPRRAVPGHGDRRDPPVPGDPRRRHRDRGGRGGRPPARDRGGGPAPAVRRGRPARGRALDARAHPADPDQGHQRPRRGLVRGRRAWSTSPPCGSSSTSTARTSRRPTYVPVVPLRLLPHGRGRAGRRVRPDPGGRHLPAPPVRVVHGIGRAVHRPGRRRPRRPDDQADPVPDLGRLARSCGP